MAGEYDPDALRFSEVCDNCAMPICGVADLGGWDGNETIATATWPVFVGGKDYPDVPEHIASTANEGHIALNAGAHRASAVMARAVIEATAKDKGIIKGSIKSKIDALYDAKHLLEHVKEAAHEVRLIANEIAHGDIASQSVSREEAAQVIDFMDEILEEVYQSPARVAKFRASRLAKREIDQVWDEAEPAPF